MGWTRKAAWMLVGSLLAGTLALALRNPQLLAAATVFTAALVVASLHRRQPRLHAETGISADRVFEEQDVEATVRLRNAGRRTGLLEVQDRVPANMHITQGRNHALVDLRRGASITLAYTAQPQVRGQYDLGVVRVRSMDPFALRSQEARLPGVAEPLTVYPRFEEVSDIRLQSRLPKIFLGENPVRQPGAGSEFYNLREFQSGDQLKDVNWKASVRSSVGREGLRLLVNHKERVSIADSVIFLDARAVSTAGLETRNALTWGARAAATFARYLIQRRDRVALATYGDQIRWLPHGSGEQQLYTILSRLASLEAAGQQSLLEAVQELLQRLSSKSPVIIVSSLVDDDGILEAVSTLRAHGMIVSLLVPNAVDLCLEEGSLPAEAHRVQRARHELLLSELRSLGAAAYDWRPGLELDAVLGRPEVAA